MGMFTERQAHTGIRLFSMPIFFLFHLMTMTSATEVTVFQAMIHRSSLRK
jgi:hypothetical protein